MNIKAKHKYKLPGAMRVTAGNNPCSDVGPPEEWLCDGGPSCPDKDCRTTDSGTAAHCC